MTEIINLRRARKAKERGKKDEQAAENRARHGVSKQTRDLTRARTEKAQDAHDAHHLDPDKPLEN